MTRFARSPQARSRLTTLSAALFGVMAALSWWTLIQDGPSPAKLIAAIATTVGAIVQTVVRVRGRRVERDRD